MDLDSLLGHLGSLGGDLGGLGPLELQACRRLACDGTVTRVLVTRHPTGPPNQRPPASSPPASPTASPAARATAPPIPTARATAPPIPTASPIPAAARAPRPGQPPTTRMGPQHRAGRRHSDGPSWPCSPRPWAAPPPSPWTSGRTTRVVAPAQPSALAIRDRGWVVPGCSRLGWCHAHHRWHWRDGSPTDLTNLIRVCRAHHRAIHEGRWQLAREPDGRVTTTPPSRRHPGARRPPPAA
ncbi:MAG TPA: HNH endonuclease signature motif containing protein [Actinomycetes bacterium]|nr:HNH endonuclease signature motif containing protein [Actinomycetes bacterium]